jgi:segregation and condensation protein B
MRGVGSDMDSKQLKNIIEAALLAAGRPLNVDKLQALFSAAEQPARQEVRAAIMELQADYAERGIEITEVASGFRIQVKAAMAPALEKLWEERPPRYSRALLETLSIIAYRQPVTRGEIENIRGVAVSTNIVRTLLERSWIRVVGHRDVPGRPAMFGTTREFLDYFDLKKLDDLPPLSELKDFDKLNVQLDLPDGEVGPGPGWTDIEGQQEDADEIDSLVGDAGGDILEGDDSAVFEPGDADNVASIEDARAAAAQNSSAEPAASDPDESQSATVLPLKQP